AAEKPRRKSKVRARCQRLLYDSEHGMEQWWIPPERRPTAARPRCRNGAAGHELLGKPPAARRDGKGNPSLSLSRALPSEPVGRLRASGDRPCDIHLGVRCDCPPGPSRAWPGQMDDEMLPRASGLADGQLSFANGGRAWVIRTIWIREGRC